MAQKPVLGVEITGWGSALPERAVSNDELISEYELESDNQWILERTGIESRHLCGPDENVVTLGVSAARQALQSASINPPYKLDKLFLGTTTPYLSVPGTHPSIQAGLGEQGWAIASSKESNTACTGFVTSLLEAYRNFQVDGIESAVVIGADTLWDITDETDRSTAILFADGAGAVVMEGTEQQSGLLGWHEETDGNLVDILYCRPGEKIQMYGREVFKHAVHAMERAGSIALANAGLEAKELTLTVPHQANVRIIESAAKRLGVDMANVAVTLPHHGNTSSASIPMALAESLDAGKIERGERLLLVGFGAGMTAAAAVIEW
ncbi:MAG TPA: beta-ketoacyl-ACP synthase 3 [Candidatus Saccharimonadales bacterium]|nr:beta-ketoacyl-ACP synthase 3 [Candidatus Saccharimonadales bacterium]